MRHIPVTREQRETMLGAIGLSGVEQLFDVIPPSVRLSRPLALPRGMTEMDLAAHLRTLADRDRTGLVSFLGAGCYDHYRPSIVDHVVSKPELFTAYTPYQPEVSQGTLQAVYEFQSMICMLTGMEVSNASMYDGATAAVEAAHMAARLTRRHRVVVSPTLHPEWIETLRTYAEAGTLEIRVAPISADGLLDLVAVEPLLADAAALIVSQPGFFGGLEDLDACAEHAHAAGALLIAAVNPILAGVLERPGSSGADIVVGEGQPLGNAMSFGGPGFGFFACRMEHVRQMPGRVVGRTRDVDGRIGYVLTLQTREQHIRREKATSNICSNHSLNALAASAYLASVGPEGLRAVGRACVAKAHYLREGLLATGRFSAPWETPFAYEFALAFEGDLDDLLTSMLARGVLAGVAIRRFPIACEVLGDDLAGRLLLLAVTEKRTRGEMDRFCEEVAAL